MSLSKPVTVLLVAGTAAGIYCVYKAFKYYHGGDSSKSTPKYPDPNHSDWKQVGTLSGIFVYPIKSCGNIHLESAQCTSLGLKNGWLRDRFLMVIDSENNFITARKYPNLFSVEPKVRNTILTLNGTDMKPLDINLAEVIAVGKPTTATVWGVEVRVYDCGLEAEQWFGQVLNQPEESFRLVYYASQECRQLRDTAHSFYKISEKDTGALPDETPYNLINQASVDNLNLRLEKKENIVSHRNFRPNFLLEGAKPYDEDNWNYIKIGDSIFEIVKPCTRCVMTTIDPETGVRNENSEPLKTLRSYRLATDPEERKQLGTSPKMGIQMALRSTSGTMINVNVPVYAMYR